MRTHSIIWALLQEKPDFVVCEQPRNRPACVSMQSDQHLHLCKHLDPDQAGKNIHLGLDPNFLTLMVFLKEYFEKKSILKKKSAEDTKV